MSTTILRTAANPFSLFLRNASFAPGTLPTIAPQLNNPESGFTLTCTLTATSATMTAASTTGVRAGMRVQGAGIVAGSYVVSFVANTSITISAAATVSGSSAVEFYPDGVIQCGTHNECLFNYATLAFFGVGSAAQTFNAKVIGWKKAANAGTNTSLWVPRTLADLLCTLGSTAGVGTTAIPSTALMAGTVAVNSSKVTPNYTLDTADLGIQYITLDLQGSAFVQLFIGTPGSGTPVTSANGLFSGF